MDRLEVIVGVACGLFEEYGGGRGIEKCTFIEGIQLLWLSSSGGN